MDAPISTFRNLVILLVGVAVVIHGFVFELVLPSVRGYQPLQAHAALALLVTTVLTGTTLYTLVVAIPVAIYIRGAWKLFYPALNFSGDWVAQINPLEQMPEPPRARPAPLGQASYLALVEIHQELFRVQVAGLSPDRSRFSSLIAGLDEKAELWLIYEHVRLRSDPEPELNIGTTQGVDRLRVAAKTRLGRPAELHGQWQMCALPNTRLFRGSSKFIRISKRERSFLKSALEQNPSFTLEQFEQWRRGTRSQSATGATKP